MTVVIGIAVAAGCAAVAEDLWRRQVSNWTSGGALAGGLVCHLVQGGWKGGGLAMAGAAIGFAIFLVFYLMNGIGGGDLKLMAGFGSLLGPGSILISRMDHRGSGRADRGAVFGTSLGEPPAACASNA